MTREEAIKDIQENIKPFVGGKSLDMAIEALKAEPVKHGRWVSGIADGYENICSVCHHEFVDKWDNDSNYCPNCGAKMREGENLSKEELDYSQICWSSAKCKYKTKDGNCKLNHCVGEGGEEE